LVIELVKELFPTDLFQCAFAAVTREVEAQNANIIL
jgi:hypothetical protein